MTDEPAARASANQRRASDPKVSAFVDASAGAGKTKLLTDRILRLMLAGTDPARLLCLTYTRAAAAEMALRLNAVLARWVRLDNGALEVALADLGVTPTPRTRGKARQLFARVLELPGGMRISTIHAFCQSVLRRFPLEAGLSPHFRLIEDADITAAMRAAREAALAGIAGRAADEAALDHLAAFVDEDGFSALMGKIGADAARLAAFHRLGPEGQRAALRRVLGLAVADEAELLASAVRFDDEAHLRASLAGIVARGSPGMAKRAREMLIWLALSATDRIAQWGTWVEHTLTESGEPRKLINDKLRDAEPALAAPIAVMQAHVREAEDHRASLALIAATASLARLAGPIAARYDGFKEEAGFLDYADLISRTLDLLASERVGWVLYKLDGGLDHLLIDEAQDTAPAQWRIAHALSAEFFAGDGANAAPRTVFAVGDAKQSIYSFQGADPAALDPSRETWRKSVEESGGIWHDVPLDVSFRSTAPILALVDAVFADDIAGRGVVAPDKALRHFAARGGDAGRVELWPLLTPADEADAGPAWSAAPRLEGEKNAPARLAAALAGWIATELAKPPFLPSRGRNLHAGDILVLVRKRDAFSAALVRALKAAGIKIAGLDRIFLTEQPAVADLLTLCDVLLLPEDELSLAALLVSPLGGLSDESLMALALGRRAGLWPTLLARADEREEWRRAADFLRLLRARVDFTTPYALLAEALGRLGGRARLYARLGPEAAEPVDELLATARAYAATHPPSLQGFVHWLRGAGAEVKRAPEAAGDAVRIMTVHGAKGLQAPLVILPDTTGLPPAETSPLLWAADPLGAGEVPLWSPRKEMRAEKFSALLRAEKARREEEYNRLLYVALTRAEDWLVVCGWQGKKALSASCWYRMVERGMARLSGVRSEPCPEIDPSGEMARLSLRSPQTAPILAPVQAQALGAAPLPDFVGRAPDWRAISLPPEPSLPQPLAPSRPEGVEDGPHPAAASPLQRNTRGMAAGLARGRAMHALLQYLPALPPAERAAAARAFLGRPGHGWDAAAAARLAEEALAILDHPVLAPLFGPAGRAEVPITACLQTKAGPRALGGLIDRLAILPAQILVADYKTNRAVPAEPAAAPGLYLRQMAAYREVLAAIYPEKEIVCALIWTAAGRVDVLAKDVLDRHAPGQERVLDRPPAPPHSDI